MPKSTTTAPELEPVDVRKAVKAARDHFSMLFQGDASLEEAVLSEDGTKWLITLGFPNPWVESARKNKQLLHPHLLSEFQTPPSPTMPISFSRSMHAPAKCWG